jgi:transposase InsO family protein
VGNLLDRAFTAEAPNRKWLVDITAVETDEGSLYLAGVLDLFSRRLVGWAMDEHMPDELTQEALEMAILQRQPPAELLHHADQGRQYSRDEYQALLAKHRMLVLQRQLRWQKGQTATIVSEFGPELVLTSPVRPSQDKGGQRSELPQQAP